MKQDSSYLSCLINNQVSIESAYDLTPEVPKRYTKWDRIWKIIKIILLAVVAIIGVALAIFTGGASLAASGASFLGIAGLILTSLGGLITVLNAVASVCEAFSSNGFNFMRDGLCGGNTELYNALAITATVMMIVGGIMSSINLAQARNAARAQDCLTGNECFIAGTLVLCKDDNGEECHKVIEDIAVGDLVWAYDEETGTSDWKPVVQLFRNKASTKCQLQFACEKEPIVCTPEHPFYILNATADTPIVMFEGKDETEGLGCWVAAKDLKAGIDELKRQVSFISRDYRLGKSLAGLYDRAIRTVKELDEPQECEFKFYKCSNCGFREEDDYRREEMCFCPSCGAKVMR